MLRHRMAARRNNVTLRVKQVIKAGSWAGPDAEGQTAPAPVRQARLASFEVRQGASVEGTPK